MLGALTLVALTLLALTGIVLTQYYNPAPLSAHEFLRAGTSKLETNIDLTIFQQTSNSHARCRVCAGRCAWLSTATEFGQSRPVGRGAPIAVASLIRRALSSWC